MLLSAEPQPGRSNKREAGEGREGEIREVGEGAPQEELLHPSTFTLSLDQQSLSSNTEVRIYTSRDLPCVSHAYSASILL